MTPTNKELLGTVSTVILVASAALVAISVVHREFFSPRNSRILDPSAEPPVYIEDWESMLEDGFFIGDSTAPAKIVEFGDFECPFCRRFHSAFLDLEADDGISASQSSVRYACGPSDGVRS